MRTGQRRQTNRRETARTMVSHQSHARTANQPNRPNSSLPGTDARAGQPLSQRCIETWEKRTNTRQAASPKGHGPSLRYHRIQLARFATARVRLTGNAGRCTHTDTDTHSTRTCTPSSDRSISKSASRIGQAGSWIASACRPGRSKNGGCRAELEHSSHAFALCSLPLGRT